MKNHVKEIYDCFTAEEISEKIKDLLASEIKNRNVKIIFQSIENLHEACPSQKEIGILQETINTWWKSGC